jgi:hypothetical protein
MIQLRVDIFVIGFRPPVKDREVDPQLVLFPMEPVSLRGEVNSQIDR